MGTALLPKLSDLENINLAPYQITKQEKEGLIELNIQFDPGVNMFNLTVDIDATYEEIEVENINTYIVQLNGVPVTLPYDVKYGDVLTITINKTIVTNSAYMTLKGKLK